jgi:hypothetical protein
VTERGEHSKRASSPDIVAEAPASDKEAGWEQPRKTFRARRHTEEPDETFAQDSYYQPLQGLKTGWWDNQGNVDMMSRVMDEMAWHHDKSWGKHETREEPLNEDPLTTDSAGVLKKAFVRAWTYYQPHIREAGHPVWSQGSALWNRIALHRLRFQSERRWYAVCRTADLQRRILVLHVPTGRGSREQKTTHARLQATYQDTPAGLFAPGIRVSQALQGKLDEPELKAILREGFRPRYIREPQAHHGKNYGGVLEHADKVEAQLQLERGLYNEGPLHYVPFIVTDMNALYYEEKDKLRLIWDCRKSTLNECLERYGGPFDALEEVLRWQRPDCWNSGWDLADAFRSWALHQVDCDTIGIRSQSTGEYDRVRYLPFGVGYSPEVQGRMMQALKPVWDREVPAYSQTDPDTFKVAGVWVDDGNMRHDGHLTKAQADSQFQSFLDWASEYGLDVSMKKNIWPTKKKEYVGFVIDSEKQEVSLTATRIDKYVAEIDKVLSHWGGGTVVPPRTNTSGNNVLDICGGLGTARHALLEADVAVGKHWLVEVDPDTRRMADRYSALIGERYPHRSVCGEEIDYSLPQDVELITEAQIQALGRIDIMCCAWPCQGLSRAARQGQGLDDKRSGLFWHCAQILKWVRKHNPHAEFMFENVDFGTRNSASMQSDYATVSRVLGVKPYTQDAGWVSGAHRVRSYWCSWKVFKDIRQHGRPELEDLLDADHTAPRAAFDDVFPMAPLNVKGQKRRCYPTVMRSADTYSVRSGTALVRNINTNLLELPRVRELERLLGLLEGATLVPGVSEEKRRQACGNVIDRRMLTWLFSNLRETHLRTELPAFTTIDRHELAELVGKLQFTAKVVDGGQAHLSKLYEGRDWFAVGTDRWLTMKQQWRTGIQVRLTADMIEELHWWREALLSDPRRRYYCTGSPETTGFWEGKTATPQEELVHCARTSEGIRVCRTDASGYGGGAEDGDESFLFQYPPSECAPHRSSNWRELNTVLRTVIHFKEKWRGQRVLIMCDNSVSCSIVRRQGSQATELNALYKQLRVECQAADIDLALRHIKGEDNVLADALSRYIRGIDKSDWLYSPAEFKWVTSRIGSTPTVDAFADPMGHNSLCPRFYHIMDDSVSHDWTGTHTWCNADFRQLERVLQHYTKEKRRAPLTTSATFCVPVWMDKCWWRHLKGMEVVAFYPAGEHIFTSPDWHKLERSDGLLSWDAVRRDAGPTQWGVLILHDPVSTVRRQEKVHGDQVLQQGSAPVQVRGLPRVQGDAVADALLLQRLQRVPLQRLSADGPAARRPGGPLPRLQGRSGI